MPPRRLGAGAAREEGYLQAAYRQLTAAENQSIIRSVAVFGAAVAIFNSSWSDFLLPPF